MNTMDYYKVLGVRKDAPGDLIKRAFRCRAKLLHPDVNAGSRAKQEFQLVNEAYQVLKNAENRRLYDLRLARGNLSRKVYYRPGKTNTGNRAATYAQYRQESPFYEDAADGKRISWFEKLFERFLFFTMLMLGLSALFYGVYRALGEPVEGVNPYLGIVFGLIFTSLFLFGWDKMQRLKT